MTTIDRLVLAGCLATGAVNLVLLLQLKDGVGVTIQGLQIIVRAIFGSPA